MQLELLDGDGALLAEGKTDSAGHAQLPLPAKAQVLLAKQGRADQPAAPEYACA
ncbi:hypothetical protein [Ectopseudomonas mendocina]|uniref:hypothetical protein n=1 Tax=Ectopseudomonas mendocina TaxID=300 RepID=UPI000B0FBFCC